MTRVRFTTLTLTLALAVTAAAPAAAADWVSLFDGKTMSGWENVPLKAGNTSKWEVKDGALTGTGEASMLYSPKGTYQNFRYRAEIKINDKGNSGMYIRCPEKKGSFNHGYEIQINSTHGDPIKTGSVYTLVHVYKQLVPAGEWFTQEVEVVTKNYRGKTIPHIKVSVNGEVLYEMLDHSNQFPGAGYFAFQGHDPGSVVRIRKVEVMELPPTK
jgi:opacity protein-like surface antigen